ncbi:4Fe-4S dicluster domain-containing protein [Raoultibacter massiliensis]|uniref:4Fe-4S dicluster domain-containing protein n=1 Tax=Raoultibacter massiliensis TaxID=1852371 RepID=UPI003A91C8BD
MSLGFYYDQTSCIGCLACQVACKDRNNLEPGYLFRQVASYETGAFPAPGYYHYSASCNHCEAPACVANCPTGALQKDPDDDTTQRDTELCIGCGTCVQSCPYGVPILLEGKGKAGSCDSCKSLRDEGANPACVDACPMRALEFGDVEEIKEKHGDALTNTLPILPSPEKTKPRTQINARPAALMDDFREVLV